MAWTCRTLLLGSLLLATAAGKDFLSISLLDDSDDSENTTTALPSTTVSTTTATSSMNTSWPRSMVIRGAVGASAELVNGHYKIDDVVNGHPSYIKISDTRLYLAFMKNQSGSSGAWYVTIDAWVTTPTHEGGYLRGECEGSCLPADVSEWLQVTGDDGIWRAEKGVKVHVLTESLASDWFAPAVSLLAALVAVAAASSGAGSFQKGAEQSSMKGVWFSSSERYTVAADAPANLPPMLVSLLGLAFPVPLAAGELRLRLQPSSAPDVQVEFSKAERGPLLWRSDEGAAIRRLGKDTAEFSAPGLEPRLLRRASNDKRSRALLAAWLLLVCVWLRAPLDPMMAGACVVVGIVQVVMSALAARCRLPGSERLSSWGWLLRGAAVAFPVLCLLVFDFYSQTLSGTIAGFALVSLHALSLTGPRLLMAKRDLLTAAGLAAWLCVSLGLVFFFAGALVYIDLAWAFDRSKSVVVLACAGSWLAVPMQVGEKEAIAADPPVQAVQETVAVEPLADDKQDLMSNGETTLGEETEAGTMSRSESSQLDLSASPDVNRSGRALQSWGSLPQGLRPLASPLAEDDASVASAATGNARHLASMSSAHGSELSRSSARSKASSRTRDRKGQKHRDLSLDEQASVAQSTPQSKEDLLLAMLSVPTDSSLSRSKAASVASEHLQYTPLHSSAVLSQLGLQSSENPEDLLSTGHAPLLPAPLEDDGAHVVSKRNRRAKGPRSSSRAECHALPSGDMLLPSAHDGFTAEDQTQPAPEDAVLAASAAKRNRRVRGRSARRVEQHAEALQEPDFMPVDEQYQVMASEDAASHNAEMKGRSLMEHAMFAAGEQSSLRSASGMVERAHSLASSRDRAGCEDAQKRKRRPKKDDTSLSAVSSQALDVPSLSAAPATKRGASAGPASVSSSLSAAHSLSQSKQAPTAKVGETYIFVNRSGRQYDPRCQEHEPVIVIKVGGKPPVKVQWQSGFAHRVMLEDLTAPAEPAMPDLPQERRVRRTRSTSRRAIRQMPDMPDMDF